MRDCLGEMFVARPERSARVFGNLVPSNDLVIRLTGECIWCLHLVFDPGGRHLVLIGARGAGGNGKGIYFEFHIYIFKGYLLQNFRACGPACLLRCLLTRM